MKKIILLAIFLLAINAQAQERDRRAELHMECHNPHIIHISVAPDGSLWMVSSLCGEIFQADNIHSTWRTVEKGESLSVGKGYENITAFNHNTAVISGNIWAGGFKDIKRTSTGGLMWEKIKYSSIKGDEWFHSAWRGEEGCMWIGSQDGMLAFSTDSGRTFTTLRDTAFEYKTGIEEIYMLSTKNGFISCHDNSLYATTDNWRSYRRLPTPFDQNVITKNGIVGRVRQWSNYLIVEQEGESFYTPSPLRDTPSTIGGKQEIKWQHTPITLRDFEVDPATGRLWGVDESHQVVMTEDFKRWTPMNVNVLSTIGIHEGHLYCKIEEGVMRVGADGVVDSCPFLTTEHPIEEPENTLAHGKRLWGHDGKSIYIHDSEGWYRVARTPTIWGMTSDPTREDRVVIMNDRKENYSIDTAGRVEPYIYRQPLAAFVKPGLKSLDITTYEIFGWFVDKETIRFLHSGDRLVESSHMKIRESYDPHLRDGYEADSLPMAAENDAAKRQLSVSSVEKSLLTLGERYTRYPTPQDFGLKDTTLDLHTVFETETCVRSSNKHGYTITLVNQTGDTLKAYGQTDSHVNLGGSTRFPWLLPMYISWREAEFFTYQPVLWQTLREAMPDSMFMKDYLDNSTLRPEEKLQSGDLLFVSSKWYESDMEQAIKASTGQYSHMALVEVDSLGVVWVIEATPGDGVKRKTFNRFKIDNHLEMFGSFDIYRFTIHFDTAAVIAHAKSHLGQPYDDAFLPNNGALYCSELIYECFLDAAGKHLFEAKPMNWRDKDGNLPEYWEKHFEELGIPVPEGVPGTNPTDLSRSPLLRRL